MGLIKNLTIGAFATFALSAGLLAGPATVARSSSKAVVETVTKSAITGDLGVNFVSEYINRGAVKENQGVIAQPYADLYLALFEAKDSFINKVTLDLGIWASLHSRHTGAIVGSTTSAWYEFDYSPGVSVTFAKNYTLTVSYLECTSPNDAFRTSRNLNVNLAYDDTDLLGPWALHPHISYLRELDNKVIPSANKKGNYFEVGVAPVLPSCGCMTISVPLTVGLGCGGFYPEGRGFGFFSGGLAVSVPMTFIPPQYGAWSVNAGATYYYLPAQNARANAVNNDNHNHFVFNGGIGMTF